MSVIMKLWCFFSLLLSQAGVLAITCVSQDPNERRQEKENSLTNVTSSFTIKEGSEYSSSKFKVFFEVCEGSKSRPHCMFVWEKEFRNISVLNWSPGEMTMCSAKHLIVSASTFIVDVQISLPVKRSFNLMMLSVADNEETFKPLRVIGLVVTYKPKVTSLTVDGHEVDGDHLISEGKNVTVACSFDNGNPPAPFHLLDKSGQILRNTSNEGNVSYSFAVRCEDDWPIIGCEGAGSEFNRSVSFLVRCPPQFLKNSTTITNLDPSGSLTLVVKSHTAAVNGCLLTPLSSEDKATREVSCTLQGTKPNLLLNLHFQNESIANGNWILTLRSESGSANTTLRIIKRQNETGKQRSYMYNT
ncbi:uncharacterized protein LOC112568051 [Pomacea canaliculata]|uniref:uncharacterized protein LOC112568051 n=1 Tax=Pomacea canaliculata TaxID=400727 RepID=UPI000D726040|nr:uncharacterized protein LOC112568051 [Pomacea canaliculata]